MTYKGFLAICILVIFVYFIGYHNARIMNWVNVTFLNKEGFTPQQVEDIIQPDGSHIIGTADPEYIKRKQILTVSNGYTEKDISSLQPSNPEPFTKETTDSLGDFPETGQEKDTLSTSEFEYPNNHKFTVEYECRKTATGMFTDCGTYSANTAWTADPYKGLNCPLTNTKSPKITTQSSPRRETNAKKLTSNYGISSIGNSPIY